MADYLTESPTTLQAVLDALRTVLIGNGLISSSDDSHLNSGINAGFLTDVSNQFEVLEDFATHMSDALGHGAGT